MSKVHVKTGDTVVLLTGKDEYLYNDQKDRQGRSSQPEGRQGYR